MRIFCAPDSLDAGRAKRFPKFDEIARKDRNALNAEFVSDV